MQTQSLVVKHAIEVTAEGFGQSRDDEFFQEDVRNHVLGTPELYLVYFDGECIAFAAIENLQVGAIPVLYLGGLMVRKAYQGNGLMTTLLDFEINRSRPAVLTARTQNPCILDLMREFCKRQLHPFTGAPKGECKAVSDFLISTQMRGMDPESLIGAGLYGRCLYGNEMPMSRHPESNRFFDERINSKRGDAVLLVGEVDCGF